ncbi:MAG TPA: hypothetical protein VFO49_08945 [Nocardioides sp.]|nr:hypothetical protein [Nocardioides sp.]
MIAVRWRRADDDTSAARPGGDRDRAYAGLRTPAYVARVTTAAGPGGMLGG